MIRYLKVDLFYIYECICGVDMNEIFFKKLYTLYGKVDYVWNVYSATVLRNPIISSHRHKGRVDLCSSF